MKMDAHHRVIVSLVISAVVLFLTAPSYSTPSVILFTWMAFATSSILLVWITILSSHPREVRKIAKLQDSSRVMIFGFVITASVISLAAVYFLLKSAKGHGTNVNGHILLSITAVFVSWWLVQTIFTMRYAHLYYDTDHDDGHPARGAACNSPTNWNLTTWISFTSHLLSA